MSATRLARELKVSQTYVWRRLSGETAFDTDDLERIAAVLDVPVADLLPLDARTTVQPMARKVAPSDRPKDGRPKGRGDRRGPMSSSGPETRRPTWRNNPEAVPRSLAAA